MERQFVLLAVADRAEWAATDGGDTTPDYRCIDLYINEACVRYNVTLSDKEREHVKRNLRGRR